MDGLISVDEARAYAREHWPSPVVRRPLEALLDNCPRVEVEPDRQWISVKDRLPEKGKCRACLIYADGYTCVADWSCDKYGDDWWFYVDGEYDPEVTHWMPLPEPPKEEDHADAT